jgi:two-component system sensor histidine kinase KdpD
VNESPTGRPDPDALLRRVQAEASRERRAKLRIFFGFAPGVGKTYRMLQVAQSLAREQGLDVLVGVVETHKRAETAALLEGLSTLPPQSLEYKGRTLSEFDLDAAVARKPAVILLDELAHTNAPGARHAKRWQDAMELLDAGIDVLSTLNVQHVESLNDVVAQITHVRVRETVPDSVLARADSVELVDISPEELLTRLDEGKVYIPEQAQRATQHFFQRGNLLALRELALRKAADRVDADVLEYRAEHHVTEAWRARERLLVCVGAAPSSGNLIRAAYRVANGLRAPWAVAYVDSAALGGLSAEDSERLESHLRLAESLGAEVVRLSGLRVADALLAYARAHNVTQILLGKPTHARLWDRLRGSLLDEVVRASGNIDVHVITGANETDREVEKRGSGTQEAPPRDNYLLAAALIAGTTAVAALLRTLFSVPDLEVLYLIAVMFSGVRLGRGPSIFASALAVAAYDFCFVPPQFTFAVADAKYLLTFAMMFGASLLVSELTARIRRQERAAIAREEQMRALYELSRELGRASSAAGVAEVLARHAGKAFRAPAHVLRAQPRGRLQVLDSHPPEQAFDGKELAVAEWSLEHAKAAGRGTDTLPGAATLCVPMTVGEASLGVLSVALPSAAPLPLEQRSAIEAFARQGAFALERVHLADESRALGLRAQTEELRSTLLSTVSHDLRTPLAAITGAATSLRDTEELSPATRHELADTVCSEAERLERLVSNLLDMTRLDSGAVPLKREWVPADEIIGSPLTRLERLLAGRSVKVSVQQGTPLLAVDPVLFEQVLVNLLENAVRHTPGGTPIEVAATHGDGWISLEVRDRGPGVPAEHPERVFDRFFRGTNAGGAGAGLGLAICRAIATAHGGTIAAANRPGGGAIFRVQLPIVSPPTGEPT